MTRRRGGATATSNFGVGPHESHDSTAFYARFSPKMLSREDTLASPFVIDDPLVCGDARSMSLPDNSVALVVTSPPYFAGKEYEEALGRGVIPALTSSISGCSPTCSKSASGSSSRAAGSRSTSPIWGASPTGLSRRRRADPRRRPRHAPPGRDRVAEGRWRAGSCAWGSYRSPTNPVLRDVSERVIVALKGRFDRALTSGPVTPRAAHTSPRSRPTSSSTPPSTSGRSGPSRLAGSGIRRPSRSSCRTVHRLYTFQDDLVLDPFLGSGTTAVAAVRCGRRFAGYDTDPAYIALAGGRVREEQLRIGADRTGDDQGGGGPAGAGPAGGGPASSGRE